MGASTTVSVRDTSRSRGMVSSWNYIALLPSGLASVRMPIVHQGIVRTEDASVNGKRASGGICMTREEKGCRAGRRGAWTVAEAVLLGLVHGCGRDEADGLPRIGRKALARAEPLTEEA